MTFCNNVFDVVAVGHGFGYRIAPSFNQEIKFFGVKNGVEFLNMLGASEIRTVHLYRT